MKTRRDQTVKKVRVKGKVRPAQATARDLLLEIGTEEIPARFMPGVLEQLQEKGAALLREQCLSFGEVRALGTPRRLVLYVTALAAKQPDREEKKKGPARERAFDQEGKPTAAARGFAAKLGLRVEDLQLEQTEKGEYLVALHKISGARTVDLLGQILPGLIKSLSFPKNMYWEINRFRFARPLRWLLCLYGEEQVRFQCAGLSAGQESRGHRFLAPGPFSVKNAAHYFALLPEKGVILDQAQRSRLIKEEVEKAAASCGERAVLDKELLQEVTFLVEQPQALLCSFPGNYLALPREVLVTTMQSHQRYFPVEDKEGKIRPFFVTVSNNPAAIAENVRAGNEKVLKARLADARFFYEEDRRSSLEMRVEKLKEILYQEKLGTVYDKMERLVALTAYLADRLPGKVAGEKEAALRAARLAKADLATHMVGEFPELQGIMGREYALADGEDEKTAVAVYEHYLPRFTGDALPRSRAGMLVALADKADHLAGCFAAGIRPSGSQDPYALRRQSLGLLQILLEHALPLPFSELIEKALLLYGERLPDLAVAETVAVIKEFTWQRLRHYLQERGIDYDLVDGVLAAPVEDVAALWQRARFLQEKRGTMELALAAAAYTRVANLALHADPAVVVHEKLLQEAGERELYSHWQEAEPKLRALLAAGDYSAALARLARFKEAVDPFFDTVLVMVEDEKIRANRLALLSLIRAMYLRMADFAKIVFVSPPE
ncbi:MAG: glycine--tRNA ligase subunit beta [Bacillota bacterium]